MTQEELIQFLKENLTVEVRHPKHDVGYYGTWMEPDELQQEQLDGLYFTPIMGLIQKIPSENWNDTVNNYAKKLRDCLIKEGYRKDAEVLQGYLSYMNGNNVPMATMDEQARPEVQVIQWTGHNLKEVIGFTGKSPRFEEWFKSWEEYENYVHTHNDILKLFCEDGSHYEVPVGAWIVKTPDGHNVPSVAKYVQQKRFDIIDSICTKAGIPAPYKDGNQWSILKGANIQEGVVGFGDTKEEALANFIKDIQIQQEQPGADALVKMIWRKESDHPNNKHPYPVINPDGEMAFAYYDGIYGWQFDRDFPHSVNMMWIDIERILPFKDNDSISTNTSTDMKTGIDLELEKEIDEKWDEFVSSEGEREDFTNIVRHFAEWGAIHLNSIKGE